MLILYPYTLSMFVFEKIYVLLSKYWSYLVIYTKSYAGMVDIDVYFTRWRVSINEEEMLT